MIILAAGYAGYSQLGRGAATAGPNKIAGSHLQFDSGLSSAEKSTIAQAISDQTMSFEGTVDVHVTTSLQKLANEPILKVYVPVMNPYTTKLKVSLAELKGASLVVPSGTSLVIKESLQQASGAASVAELASATSQLTPGEIGFVPAGDLSDKFRLLSLDGSYYLDGFDSGALFRQVKFSGADAKPLASLQLAKLPTKDEVLKVNMTGVTALSRKYIMRLASGQSPDFFSAKIAGYLKDADIVHTSNEVSFKDNCELRDMQFCAPASTIETLKSSGINLIELTGNHNNDFGSDYNAATIEQYHKLGWHTFGGGIKKAEAAKPYVSSLKGSKVAFFGYNYADSPNGGPIATVDGAGANSFDFDRISSDIATAKSQGDYVIVDVQFWECYAYPALHAEIPLCDQPIKDQESTFRRIIDLGADMVIGTQAHQPQTYEIYKGKQIYYGLGNLFFDQVEWPGTERGIILTHYFYKNQLLQTKLTPTIYDTQLQVHIDTDEQANLLLNRLKTARQESGL